MKIMAKIQWRTNAAAGVRNGSLLAQKRENGRTPSFAISCFTECKLCIEEGLPRAAVKVTAMTLPRALNAINDGRARVAAVSPKT